VMAYDEKTLNRIFERTRGQCHICGKQLSRRNYNQPGRRGAWEVEHSVPLVKGGSDHGNNLFPAHIKCNREKGTHTSKTARSWHGRTRAPLSKARREKAKAANAIALGIIGGVLGAVAGPPGAFVGASLGAAMGASLDPEK